MLTILPPPCSRITGTTARHVRNIEATLTSITCRHSSSGISVNGRIASDAYSPALLTRMSMPPCRPAVSRTSASTSASLDTSARMPPSGGFRSATTTVAPSRSSPRAMAAPIPWAPPVTIAIFPSSCVAIGAGRSADRGERGRHHDPVPLRVEEWLQPGEERLPARVGLQSCAALLAFGVAGVAPEADDRGQLADVDGEPAEQVAEVLLLDRDALVLVHLHDLGQLARDHVVGALLDDHAADSTSGARAAGQYRPAGTAVEKESPKSHKAVRDTCAFQRYAHRGWRVDGNPPPHRGGEPRKGSDGVSWTEPGWPDWTSRLGGRDEGRC